MNFYELPEGLSRKECGGEHFESLLTTPGVCIERIVSTGQATPEGEWYDQSWDEWVIVIEGKAALSLGVQKEAKVLEKGDSIFIPAHLMHRVEWTDPQSPTLWLAVHFNKNTESNI